MIEATFARARALAVAEAELMNLRADAAAETAPFEVMLANAEARAVQIRKTIQQIKAHAEGKAAEIEQMRAALLDELGDADGGTFEGVTITVKKAGGVQALELDAAYKKEPAKLPEEFHKTRIEPDNEAIRAALDEGRELEFARLLPRKRTVIVEVAE